jgi:4-aminobutyrate aminotransferase/(S)-3-amino-2-methylpropionate transaminase
LEGKLRELAQKHDYIGEIRRLGAMVGCEIVEDRISKKPNKAKTAEIVKYANENGLLLLSAGLKGNVIRFLTPLVITDEELEKGLAILEKAFA